MAEEIRTIGPANGLQFEIQFGAKPTARSNLGWGRIRLVVEGTPVWDDSGTGIEWTLVDLLEFLSRAWWYLLAEESWPVATHLAWPMHVRSAVQSRWEEMDESEVDLEEDQINRFFERHDLAWAFQGLFVSSVLLVRHGALFLVTSQQEKIRCIRPYNEVVSTLCELGDCIAEYVADSDHSRAQAARHEWCQRTALDIHTRVSIRTGLSTNAISQIEADLGTNESVWTTESSNHGSEDTPILAAARMTAGVLDHDQKLVVMRIIHSLKRGSFDKLETLAARIEPQHLDREIPYLLGYRAAEQVRRVFGFGDGQNVNPDDVLRELNVYLDETSLSIDEVPLDAVAVWGRSVGPAVLINSGNRSRAAHFHGRRSTYAHELCHLLLDRDGALPVGEVLGGRVPALPEKRARAFAAEFLLPRQSAASVVRSSTSVLNALTELTSTFGVSEEVAAWQIINGSAREALSEEETTILKSRLGADSSYVV